MFYKIDYLNIRKKKYKKLHLIIKNQSIKLITIEFIFLHFLKHFDFQYDVKKFSSLMTYAYNS